MRVRRKSAAALLLILLRLVTSSAVAEGKIAGSSKSTLRSKPIIVEEIILRKDGNNTRVTASAIAEDPAEINDKFLALLEYKDNVEEDLDYGSREDQRPDQSEALFINVDNTRDLENIRDALSAAEYESQRINPKKKRKTQEVPSEYIDPRLITTKGQDKTVRDTDQIYYEVPRSVGKSGRIDKESTIEDRGKHYPSLAQENGHPYQIDSNQQLIKPLVKKRSKLTASRAKHSSDVNLTIPEKSSESSDSTKPSKKKKKKPRRRKTKSQSTRLASLDASDDNTHSIPVSSNLDSNLANQNQYRKGLELKYDSAPRPFSANREPPRNVKVDNISDTLKQYNNLDVDSSNNRNVYDKQYSVDNNNNYELSSSKMISGEASPKGNHEDHSNYGKLENLEIRKTAKTPAFPSYQNTLSTNIPYTIPSPFVPEFTVFPANRHLDSVPRSNVPSPKIITKKEEDEGNSEVREPADYVASHEANGRSRSKTNRVGYEIHEAPEEEHENTGDNKSRKNVRNAYNYGYDEHKSDSDRNNGDYGERKEDDRDGGEGGETRVVNGDYDKKYYQNNGKDHAENRKVEEDYREENQEDDEKGHGENRKVEDDSKQEQHYENDGEPHGEKGAARETYPAEDHDNVEKSDGGDADEKDENVKFEKGDGSKRDEEHHESKGEKGLKDYKSYHEDEKASKGRHDKEKKSNFYEEKDGEEKQQEEDSGYQEEYHGGEKGEKEADFSEKGEHKKGHSTKGQHFIHKKDEYEKKTEFFDEYHEDGDVEKDGEYLEEHEASEGGQEKSSHHDEEDHQEKYGKKTDYEAGGHYHEDKGHKIEEGQDSHQDHEEKHGKKGGTLWKKSSVIS